MKNIIVNEENSSGMSKKEMLRSRTFVVPLILSCTLFMFQAMSGTDILSYYNGVIFKDVGLSEEYVAILYQVSQEMNMYCLNQPKKISDFAAKKRSTTSAVHYNRIYSNPFFSVVGNPGIPGLNTNTS